jgi:hypothetical protein
LRFIWKNVFAEADRDSFVVFLRHSFAFLRNQFTRRLIFETARLLNSKLIEQPTKCSKPFDDGSVSGRSKKVVTTVNSKTALFAGILAAIRKEVKVFKTRDV